MTTNYTRPILASLCVLAIVFGAISCSQTESAKLQTPTFYDDAAITSARSLIGEGYDLLDGNDLDGALAKFAEIETLVPSGLVGPYHSACAYARTGDEDGALASLTTLVGNGYDSPASLQQDSDLEPLWEDARFEALVKKATDNYDQGSAAFAGGMPEYAEATKKFASEDELKEWADQQNQTLRSHGRYWTANQMVAAKIDFAAMRLAALSELKGDDPEFDGALERVRVATRLKSRYEYGWGTVSDLVQHEVDAYLKKYPKGLGADEVNCLAGFALSQKYAEDDAMRSRGFEQAETYLARVAEGSEWHGPAQALIITNKIQTPGADETALGAQLAAVIKSDPGNRQVYTTISTRFSNSGAQYLWPIALGMQDLDDKTVTLDEYKGKVLLIDFWATWCPPCRAELPKLVKVYDTYHKQGFEIISISLDFAQSTTPDAYRRWIDSAGMNWRHAYDGDGWDTESIERFFVSSIPAPFLVGTDGSLIAWGEDCRGDKLESTIQAALAKSSI